MTRSVAQLLAEGDAHYDVQRWNEAGEAFERALASGPGTARAWYRLGNVREEQGRDEDAAACFESALALDPAHAQAWNNLGGAHQRLGRETPAIEAYRRAISADPALAQPYLNLGRLLAERGDRAGAAACFGAALEQHPGDPSFAHLLAAARGERTAGAPRGYVQALFDGVAPQFEHHLVRELDYRVPQALAALVRPRLPAAARVFDLGCGTGLVGAALTGCGARVTGVDLSPRMLEIALARRAYARLELGDAVEALERAPAGSVHAVLAADVFIYLGDLEAVFRAAARALAAGGVFAFSVEGLEGEGFSLQPSGRYAHAPAYLRTLGARAGLEEQCMERARVRRQRAGYTEGWLAMFER